MAGQQSAPDGTDWWNAPESSKVTQTNVNANGAGPAAYGRDGSVTGAVNLRSAHTFAIRVRHTSTATNYDSVIAGYSITSGGNDNGSFISRFNGDPATQLAWYRWDGAFTFNVTRVSGAYGDTTTWHHVAFVYDGTNITPYLDGVAGTPVASAATLTTSTTSVRIWAGGPHPGVFADAVFVGRALSAGEIQGLASFRKPQCGAGDLIAWCPEFSDGVTQDLSTNNNQLSIIHSGTGTNPTTSNEAPPDAFTAGQVIITAPAEILRALAASGTTNVTGAVASTESAALIATGTTNVTGSAATTKSAGIVASGTTNVTGAATVSGNGISIVATGSTACSGSSDLPSALRTRYSLGFQPAWCIWAAWVLPRSSVANSEVVYVPLSGAGPGGFVKISLQATTLHFEVNYSPTATLFTFDQAVSIGTWYHAAICLQFSTCQAYVNGALVGSGALDLTGVTGTELMDWQRNGDMTLRDAVNWNTSVIAHADAVGILYGTRSAARRVGVFFNYYPLLEGGGRLESLSRSSQHLDLLGTVPETSENPPAAWGASGVIQAFSNPSIFQISASGTTNVTASASSSESAGLVATGSTQVTGQANVIGTGTGIINASGSTAVTGTAAISSSASLVATGSTQVTGAASIPGPGFRLAAQLIVSRRMATFTGRRVTRPGGS
jgi:Concanavalin A-like lectin/glucanases superfamily